MFLCPVPDNLDQVFIFQHGAVLKDGKGDFDFVIGLQGNEFAWRVREIGELFGYDSADLHFRVVEHFFQDIEC